MDFKVEDHGTVYLFTPVTARAREFVDELVDVPDYMWLGDSFAADHRPGTDLAAGIIDAGLTIGDSD